MISPNSQLNILNRNLIAEMILEMIVKNIYDRIFNLAYTNCVRISDTKNIVNFDSEYTEECKKIFTKIFH